MIVKYVGELADFVYSPLKREGYLAAMNGPEVAALVEALVLYDQIGNSATMLIAAHEASEKALANWEVSDA